MLSPGTILSSRYRIESILGQGGMGAVYLATMEALGGKKVAVKEMEFKGLSESELAQAVAQFNKEASFLANLDHPNLVQVTDFFIEGDKHYLVMAYVQGQTLQQKLKQHGKPFTWAEVKSYAAPLVEVLHYLHTQDPPILFRDLKPSNIMIEPSGRLRLIDFGIARTAQAGDRTSTFLQGTGTSGFSPIEQYGGGQSTDQRSDIYSLGATLYYLLTGKVPPDAVARISQGKKLIPVTKIQPELPAQVEQLLNKALALRQQERHSSMAEFRNEIAAVDTPSIDSEGPTKDFGATAPSDTTTNISTPTTRGPSSSTPAAIMVEMYPTVQVEKKKSPSSAMAIGAGSAILVAIAALAIVVWPSNHSDEAQNPTATASPAATSVVRENLAPPSDTKVSTSAQPSIQEPETEPTQIIETRQELFQNYKPRPTPSQTIETTVQTEPTPQENRVKVVKPNITTGPSYPKATPKAKAEPVETPMLPPPPPPFPPPPERQDPSVAERLKLPPEYDGWKRGDPPPLDAKGNPLPLPHEILREQRPGPGSRIPRIPRPEDRVNPQGSEDDSR